MSTTALTPEELRALARSARNFVHQLDAPTIHSRLITLAAALDNAAQTIEDQDRVIQGEAQIRETQWRAGMGGA